MKTDNLVAKILEKRLKNEVENILSVTKQGFDIFIPTEFSEIASTLKNILEEEIHINPRVFRLITNPANITSQNSDDLDFAFIPIILIGNHNLKAGAGFVRYSLDSPDKLLGQVASSIEIILNFFGLEKYLDCFDAKIFIKLKEIAKIRGIQYLIDAVVQTAYLAGFNGNQTLAYHYLDTFNAANNETTENNLSIETCAKRFLSHCISKGDDAFDFLKSSLSFYVVNKQGLTMSRASQILNISRTTLLEHLKIADKIGVPTFFEHGVR